MMDSIKNLSDLKDIVIRYKVALEDYNNVWIPFLKKEDLSPVSNLSEEKQENNFKYLNLIFSSSNSLLNDSSLSKKYISYESNVLETLKKFNVDVLSLLNDLLDSIIEAESKMIKQNVNSTLQKPSAEPVEKEISNDKNSDQLKSDQQAQSSSDKKSSDIFV